MSMFFVAGIGVAVLIEVLLISKKKKSAADLILTLWMFLVLIHLFLSYLFVTGDLYSVPFLLGIEQPFPLLHGVFLYLYVGILTGQLPEQRAYLSLHFVPALLVYAYLVPFFLLPGEQKIEVYRNQGAGYEIFMLLRRYAIALSGIAYVGWSAVLLRRHSRAIRDTFSSLEAVNLQWLRLLTYGMGGIWVLVIFFRDDLLTLGGVVVFVFLIGFFGVRQADIFGTDQPSADDSEQRRKYPKSGLTEEGATLLHQSLKRLMSEEMLYRKPDLSVNELASRLGAQPNYLSQVINQREGKNFYDFVNAYRIDEFLKSIADRKNRQFTLLSLAYDCGFSSKTTFNRSFKKATGKTPSQYLTDLPEEPPPTPGTSV